MCLESNVQATRELQIAGGKIIQCMECQRLGIEIGTVYMVFTEDEFLRFVDWFEEFVLADDPSDREKRLIQIEGNTNVMLSLSRSEIVSAGELMRAAVPWLSGSAGVSPQPFDLPVLEGLVN